jgi:hypothetical protein
MTVNEALDELVLSRPVAEKDIARAYRRMAKRFHPDAMTDPEEQRWAKAKFLRVQTAYELLTQLSVAQVNATNEGLREHQADDATRHPQGVLFSELVKWERHRTGHSPGYLNLSTEHLWFEPYHNSILDKGFSIPLAMITRVSSSDNFLWRGAVNVTLREELRISFCFRIDAHKLDAALIKEQPSFASRKLRFFLGFGRDRFLGAARALGVAV